MAFLRGLFDEVQFKVLAVSTNRNNFGLRGMILVSRRGVAWEVATNDLHVRPRDSIVSLRGTETAPDFVREGFEIPRRLQDMPRGLVVKLWAPHLRRVK